MSTAKGRPGPALADLLTSAGALAKELSASTDDLNREIARIETLLVALRLGMTGNVDMSSVEEQNDGRLTRLEFRKSGPAWGLFVVTGRVDSDTENSAPILKAAKGYRLRAADVMADLITALLKDAVDQRAQIKEKAAKLKGLADSLFSNITVETPGGAKGSKEPTYDDFADDPPLAGDEIPF